MASFVNNAWTEAGATPNLGVSGVYTPVLTAVTNVAASTARLCTYSRVGQTVTVSGQLDVDPTTTGATELGISLPVSSSISSAYQLGGVGASPGVAGFSVAIDGDATNDRASMRWVAVDVANQTIAFVFSYQQVI